MKICVSKRVAYFDKKKTGCFRQKSNHFEKSWDHCNYVAKVKLLLIILVSK